MNSIPNNNIKLYGNRNGTTEKEREKKKYLN